MRAEVDRRYYALTQVAGKSAAAFGGLLASMPRHYPDSHPTWVLDMVLFRISNGNLLTP
jgi:hypothetical protein